MDNSKKINTYLLSLGFVPNVKGYFYIREALKIILQKPYLFNLKTEVYPIIARQFHASIESIEKNISNAIDRVFLRADIDVLYKEFAYIIDEYRGKPTIKEFLVHAGNRLSSQIS